MYIYIKKQETSKTQVKSAKIAYTAVSVKPLYQSHCIYHKTLFNLVFKNFLAI